MIVHAILRIPVGLLIAETAPEIIIIKLRGLVINILVLGGRDGWLVLMGGDCVVLVLGAAPREGPAESVPLDDAPSLLVVAEIIVVKHVLYDLGLLLLSGG